MRLLGKSQQMIELFRARHAIHNIYRNPIPSLDINLAPIDLKCVRQSSWVAVLVGNEFNVTDSKVDRFFGEGYVVVRVENTNLGLVKRLLATAIRPPQAWLLY